MPPVRDERFNLRTTSDQADRIRMAAEATSATVTEFMLASADAAAERVLADRRWFMLDDDRWAEFEATLERPAIFKPRLNELLHSEDPFVD